MIYDNPQPDWDRIKQSVFDGTTQATYNNHVRLGTANAAEYLRSRLQDDPIPNVDTIKQAHLLAFSSVYPFAGNFRQGDHYPELGEKNGEVYFQVAHTSRIEPELERLAEYARSILATNPPDHTKAEVIALYHAQFERIHPFQEGNGQIGRCILEAQITHLLGRTPQNVLDRSDYLDALWQAQTEGTLTELTYATTGLPLPRDRAVTSYNMELWPVAVQKTTRDGQTFPVNCPDIDTAIDVKDAVITAGLEKYIEQHGTLNLPLRLDESNRPLRLDVDQQTLRQNQEIDRER